jgi:hypothetical protein
MKNVVGSKSGWKLTARNQELWGWGAARHLRERGSNRSVELYLNVKNKKEEGGGAVCMVKR